MIGPRRRRAVGLSAAALFMGSMACIPGLVPFEGPGDKQRALSALWRPGRTFDGAVARGEATRFALGPAEAGQAYRVEISGRSRLSVALFDQDMKLLTRRTLASGDALEHTLRRDCEELWIAVSPRESAPGLFSLEARRSWNPRPTETSRQRVLLNFAGSPDLIINGRRQAGFGAFDAAEIDPRHAGRTDAVRAAILAALEHSFAGFGVDFFTSDEAPPAGPYAVIHFGGDDADLLGLADHVDRYNQHHDDRAIVFTRAFARYAGMRLSDEELGWMIGNVAAHELGHLLGLYHTAAPGHTMDVTGTVYDLMSRRGLHLAPLDAEVFPIGFEDAARVLSEAVGFDPTAVGETANADHHAIEGLLGEGKTLERAIWMSGERIPVCASCN